MKENNILNFLEKKIWIIAIVLVLLVLVKSTMYTITTGTSGVLSTFGKFQKESITPGLHFKLPFVQKIEILDTKMQTANYLGSQDLPDKKGVINKPSINVLDAKNLPIGLEITVLYTPKSEDVPEIMTKYGINYFDKMINPSIRDVVRDVVGKYQAEEIAKDRVKIGNELKVTLSKIFEKTEFILNSVNLRNIQLPKLVLKKIEEVQLAKQEEQRLGMVQKQAKKKQTIQTIQANTRLIEITTKAKADAEQKKIAAEAQAYSVLKQAEAQAKANDLLAKSINDKLIKYESINKWNGAYPKMLMTGEKTGTILQLPQVK